MKHIGNLEITSANEKDFANLTEVGGYLYVYGSAKLDAPLLTTVGGDLRVDGSAKLDALTTVGGFLSVYGSAKLDAPLLTTVGGDLRVYGSANMPNLKTEKPSQEVIEYIKTEPKKINRAALEAQGYLLADGLFQKIISKKTSNSLTIYKVKHIVKDKSGFVIFDGNSYSHGETLEKAKDDLKYKISSRDTSEFNSWKLTEEKPIADLIKAYRSITGACEFGTKHFCESQTLKQQYSIKEIIDLTKGQFGSEQFKTFFA